MFDIIAMKKLPDGKYLAACTFYLFDTDSNFGQDIHIFDTKDHAVNYMEGSKKDAILFNLERFIAAKEQRSMLQNEIDHLETIKRGFHFFVENDLSAQEIAAYLLQLKKHFKPLISDSDMEIDPDITLQYFMLMNFAKTYSKKDGSSS